MTSGQQANPIYKPEWLRTFAVCLLKCSPDRESSVERNKHHRWIHWQVGDFNASLLFSGTWTRLGRTGGWKGKPTRVDLTGVRRCGETEADKTRWTSWRGIPILLLLLSPSPLKGASLKSKVIPPGPSGMLLKRQFQFLYFPYFSKLICYRQYRGM